MSIYRNNNGTLESIASNIQFNNYNTENYITQEELTNKIKQLNYVTPEMYGAGDGHTSDADAFRAALAENEILLLGNNKTYNLGDEVIDLKNKKNLHIIGVQRGYNRDNKSWGSRIVGGTFLLNLNSTWTANNENANGDKRGMLLLENIGFVNHREAPQFITASLITVRNCLLLGFKSFIAIPNTCYIDKINWDGCDTWCDKTQDVDATIIKGCDAPDTYSDWNGSGDDWCFKNCSFATQGYPLFHVSNGNHGIAFENCINPNVCYGQANSSEDLPQIVFNCCHIENQYNPCSLKSGYYNKSRILTTYNNCYFHAYIKFKPYDILSGLNYYTSKSITYSSNTDTGLTPEELDRFNGVLIPYGSKYKHRKLINETKYEIPTTRNLWINSTLRSRTKVSPITDTMNYVFYYSDNSLTYDENTKIVKNDITPNSEECNNWVIRTSENKNFFLHVFRQNPNTNQVQKCVMYIGYTWLDLTDTQYEFQDGGNSIEGIYKWLDYDGEFPS